MADEGTGFHPAFWGKLPAAYYGLACPAVVASGSFGCAWVRASALHLLGPMGSFSGLFLGRVPRAKVVIWEGN